MDKCSVFVPIGALGAGIEEESFQQGLNLNPDIISLDAGFTDSGPYYLGTAQVKYARDSVKSDLRLILRAANDRNIPVTIGSCGTCGTDNMVDGVYDLCQEIFTEEGFKRKVARIYTEQTPASVASRYRQGGILPLDGAPQIDVSVIESCDHIVALAGAEPFIHALEQGAQVVLCGRATDTAVIAAYPIMQGFDRALAWHGAKIAECGAVCTVKQTEGGVLLTYDREGLTVQATAQGNQCTAYTVSAHLLYENANPVRLTEPGIVIDASHTIYTELGDGRVRVSGTTIEEQAYTMKLEGAGQAGFQTITLVGIRDPKICRNPMPWLEQLARYVDDKLETMGFDRTAFTYDFRPYGWNGVYGGPVPEGYIANEIGLLFVVTADTQELASRVAKVFNPYLLHFPVDMDKPVPSYAFPLSPAETPRGPVFAFKLHHVMKLDDPLEAVRIQLEGEEA